MKTMIGSRPMNLIDADKCPCLICAGATCEQGHAMRCERFKEWVKASEVGFKVRQKGVWLKPNPTKNSIRFVCSVCGRESVYAHTKNAVSKCGYGFCPRCGAVMTN